METGITAINEKVKAESAFVNRIKDEIEKEIVSQKYLIERLEEDREIMVPGARSKSGNGFFVR